MNEIKHFEAKQGEIAIAADLFVIGKDLLIVLTGGTHPHIGSVTMLTAEESQQTHDFPSHDGRRHKDGALSENLAKIISSSLQGSCTITSGVHFDGISWEGIQTCLDLSKQLGQDIKTFLADFDYGVTAPKYQKLPPK